MTVLVAAASKYGSTAEIAAAIGRALRRELFAEEYLPVHDVSDEIATVVAAEPQAVWQALREADLIE